MSTLDEKLAARAGRLQTIVAAMARLARDVDHGREDTTGSLEYLGGLAADYGAQWLSETADLLKEQYNRRQGP